MKINKLINNEKLEVFTFADRLSAKGFPTPKSIVVTIVANCIDQNNDCWIKYGVAIKREGDEYKSYKGKCLAYHNFKKCSQIICDDICKPVDENIYNNLIYCVRNAGYTLTTKEKHRLRGFQII